MAPSYKCAVISLLVVFFMLAPNPSAAIRASEPEDAFLAAAPAPAPRGAPHAHPQFFFGCPLFPKLLRDLCHALFPPPTTPSPPKVCRPALAARLVPPCAAFLTNSSVPAPSPACCDSVGSFFGDSSTTPFCLCHVANGDADAMLPAPVADPARRVSVLVTCKPDVVHADNIREVCDKANASSEFSFVDDLLVMCFSSHNSRLITVY